MNPEDFARRGAAAQAAVDQVVAEHELDTKLGRQLVAVETVLTALEGAFAIKLQPPAPSEEWPRLHDLVDQVAAKLPAKHRAEVLKLERRIRAELERATSLSIEAGNRCSGAGAARWAYQAGALTSLVWQFIGRVPPPAPGGGKK